MSLSLSVPEIFAVNRKSFRKMY